jgi:hypothetical protein
MVRGWPAFQAIAALVFMVRFSRGIRRDAENGKKDR